MVTDTTHILTTTVTVEDIREAASYMNEDTDFTMTQEQCDALAKRLCNAIQAVIEDFVAEI